jgi:hypothetical protein
MISNAVAKYQVANRHSEPVNDDKTLLFQALRSEAARPHKGLQTHRTIIGKVTAIAHANIAALASAPGNG